MVKLLLAVLIIAGVVFLISKRCSCCAPKKTEEGSKT